MAMASRHSALRGLPAAAIVAGALAATSPVAGQEGFKFRSGVELINVTASVTDRSGRFVGGLRQEDFLVFEDGRPVEVTHFNAERTPVSLGIVLDTSGSMQGDKMTAARNSIDRFLQLLTDPLDEFFMYRFSASPDLVHDWTQDRRSISWMLSRVHPNGGTAMYDGVAEAVPMAQGGRNRKKAIVLISDGNDTSSRAGVSEVKQLVRETEVLVYAVGIDGAGQPTIVSRPPTGGGGGGFPPMPLPFPLPGGGGRGRGGTGYPPSGYPPAYPGGGATYGAGDRLNVVALREMTDDSGGRVEIVRDPRDLDPATASIADELSKQYYIGYPSPGHRDGRWHAIRVELRDQNYLVRARKGYVATP
jgi:Ca-activated chloride channel family protein